LKKPNDENNPWVCAARERARIEQPNTDRNRARSRAARAKGFYAGAFMGEIVAAMATCHAPQLFTYPPDEDPAQLDASIAGMRELGKILDETKPDVIVFIGSDHL